MSSIIIQGDTSGSITVEAPGVAGTHTLTLPKETGTIATTAQSSVGQKNLIINGDMRIDQRNAGASVTPTDGLYTVDRWLFRVSQASKLTAQQVTDAPTGFDYSLKVTSSSAYTVGVSDFFECEQRIEGYNTAHLESGTANAKTVTLSFYVKSSLTGTFGGALANQLFDRSYPFEYSIDSADTWEHKEVIIELDKVGVWDTGNTIGLRVQFGLGVGNNWAGTANAWVGRGTWSSTGATSVVETNGATWQLTGVQLEVGDTATPFENRFYGTELALCQRYYQKFAEPTNSYGMIVQTAYTTSTTNLNSAPQFIVPMRTKPSSVTSSTLCFRRYDGSIQGGTFSATTIDSATNSTTGCLLNNTCTTVTAGWVGSVIQHNSASGYLAFSAEL